MDNSSIDLASLPAPTAATFVTADDPPTPAWTVTLSKAQIKAICAFAADDNRWMLNQVWFQDGRMYASDGHRLAIVGRELSKANCTIDTTAGLSYTPETLLGIAKTMRVGDTLAITNFGCTLTRKSGESAEVEGVTICEEDVAQAMPPIHNVVPWDAIVNADRKDADRGCPWVDGRYLADAAQAPTLAGYDKSDPNHHVRCIVAGGDLDAFVCLSNRRKTGDDITAIVVTMPLHR